MVSLPAYTIQGAYMSLRNRFAKSVDNYIAASRVIQGGEEMDAATPEEREAVLTQWNLIKEDLKNFYMLKIKEAKDGKERERAPPLFASAIDRAELEAPQPRAELASLLVPRSRSESAGPSWRAKGRDAWKKSHIDVKVAPQEHHDDEFERAIQASVRETSRGDVAEDARVERAIRQSVRSLRGGRPSAPSAASDVKTPVAEQGSSSAAEEVDLQITDEEYQELIERAIQQSTVGDTKAATPGRDDEELKRAIEESRAAPAEDDEELRMAIEESERLRREEAPADDEEELRRAIEESERIGREEADRRKERSEEDIVLEYVMKQSLQEEEYRKAMREGAGPLAGAKRVEEQDGEQDEGDGKGKGKEEGSEDEELRKAVEMSLKVGEGQGDAGPSEG